MIIIHGTGDAVISRRRIMLPSVEEQVIKRRQDVKNVRKPDAPTWKQQWERLAPAEDIRGNFLRENVFTSSPYVRMLVPKKAAYHGLPLFRDVARSGLYMLERARRELRVSQPQKTAP